MQAHAALNLSRNGQAAHELSQVCSDLFLATPLSWFGYARFTRNRELTFITTNPTLLDYYVMGSHQQTEFSHRHIDDMPTGSFFCNLLEETDAEGELHNSMIDRFNLTGFVNIIQKDSNSCEIFNFAADVAEVDMRDFYLNNVDLLRTFVSHYRDHFAAITASNRLVKMPIFDKTSTSIDSPEKLFVQRIALDANGSIQTIEDRLYLLTVRERSCLKYLVRGFSAKHVGKKLSISHRTVENHIASAKVKLNCYRKHELVTRYKHLI